MEKQKKRKNKLKWNKYIYHYFILLPKVTWLRQPPRARFLSTLKKKQEENKKETEPSSNSAHCTLYA